MSISITKQTISGDSLATPNELGDFLKLRLNFDPEYTYYILPVPDMTPGIGIQAPALRTKGDGVIYITGSLNVILPGVVAEPQLIGTITNPTWFPDSSVEPWEARYVIDSANEGTWETTPVEMRLVLDATGPEPFYGVWAGVPQASGRLIYLRHTYMSTT